MRICQWGQGGVIRRTMGSRVVIMREVALATSMRRSSLRVVRVRDWWSRVQESVHCSASRVGQVSRRAEAWSERWAR